MFVENLLPPRNKEIRLHVGNELLNDYLMVLSQLGLSSPTQIKTGLILDRCYVNSPVIVKDGHTGLVIRIPADHPSFSSLNQEAIDSLVFSVNNTQ